MFNAVVIRQNQQQSVAVETLEDSFLPEGDVTVRVACSTLNYKDALAITGQSPIVRQFPMVPGIDFAGTVTASSCTDFSVGDAVLLNGWGVGERHWGGLAEKACVQSQWLIPLPKPLGAYGAMAIGTAGYTAMLAIMALERQGVTPDKGPVIVTGATGGVGSYAVTLLAALGYSVTASTGKLEQHAYLKQLGADDIIDRQPLSEPGKPLVGAKWAGAIDCVGSHTLANVLAATQYGGTVAACGLAQSMALPASVAPFILRGVTLVGIDSVMQPRSMRITAWQRLSELLTAEQVAAISTTITLNDVIDSAAALLQGNIRGRLVVDMRH